ncbi:YCF48-related protein, partial [candidate division KSB1 bacterium]
IDSNTGWAVGYEGTILHTTDGGVNWSSQTSGTINYLTSVHFTDVNTGWAFGSSGIILYTIDGGTSWNSQVAVNSDVFNSLYFTDSNTGWAVGGIGTILCTADGGMNWTSQNSGTSNALFNVHFTDSNTGWAVGSSGTILHTTDGGVNWSIQTSGTSETLLSVRFTDANTGWIVGWSGTILHTTDGGANWNAQNSGTSTYLFGAHFTDSNTGWVVGYEGTILHTTDGGVNWGSQTSGTSNTLQSVYFTDSNTGWAVGYSATIIHTTDGGVNWSIQTSGTSNIIYGVHFTDSNTGWIVDRDGTILHTSDGGANWGTQTSGTSEPLRGVYFTDGNTGWTVGNGGIILKKSMEAIPTIANYSVFSTHGIDLRMHSDIVSGDIGVNDANGRHSPGFKYELDIGMRATTPEGYKVKANRIKIGRKAVVGGDIYYNKLKNHGTIEGQMITPLELPLLEELPPFKTGTPGDENIVVRVKRELVLEPNNYGYINVKTKGKIIFTGGIYNIKALHAGTNSKLVFRGASEIRIANKFNTDLRVYTGPEEGANIDASDIIFYIAGMNGRKGKINSIPKAAEIGMKNKTFANFYVPNGTLVLRTKTEATGSFIGKDVIVGIRTKVALNSYYGESSLAKSAAFARSDFMLHEAETELPDKFRLEQNYPNPFNPETVIRYQLPTPSKVSLKIYNIMGQEVKMLVNAYQINGYYSVKWDGTNNLGIKVASGVYIYLIQTGSFVDVKKMIFLQ